VKPYIDDDEDHFDIGFEQFKLKPGLELEVQDESSNRLLGHKAHFVMAHAGKDVLISIQENDPAKMTMEAGKRYTISGFSGSFDFSFSAAALKVDREQLTVLLAAPVSVSIRFVRKHRRADLALPASVLLPGQSSPVRVTIKNLSLGGASLASIKPLGAKDSSVTLRLQITFDNKKEELNLASVIRRISESDESLMLNTGLEFVNASRNDKLLLHYYISTSSSNIDLI
jgi:hypothetical protein